MSTKIKKGQKFGDWRTRHFLGEGGNGVVWRVSNSSSEVAAIKLLTKVGVNGKAKTYARFKHEVKAVNENSDIEGVLPIVECYLPDEIGTDVPWYVMPIAQPLDKYIVGHNFEMIIESILKIGKVLTILHERGISHRDIKPANILVKDNKFYLSDFGLVTFPDKEDLTGTGERIGAKCTIAPEMERDSQKADGKPADVYSLAKTLWILLAGEKCGFPGQYHPDSINGLKNLLLIEPNSAGQLLSKAPLLYTKPLDDLLHDSTNDDPSQRPSMSQFIKRLEHWTQIYRDFRKRNPLQWQDVQKKLFPMSLPQRVIWESLEDISQILGILCSFDFLNHMLFPDGGGMDLLQVSIGLEPDTLELVVGERTILIVRPKRLLFESFGFDMEWNYFRLETAQLEPTGIAHKYDKHESLVEIEPLYYISRNDWETDRENERKYPEDSKLVMRYVQGDFMILQKTSPYNRSAYTYSGEFDTMDSEGFRQYYSDKIELVREVLGNEQVMGNAIGNGWSVNDFINALLNKFFRNELMAKNELG